jgi:hypothetical protein
MGSASPRSAPSDEPGAPGPDHEAAADAEREAQRRFVADLESRGEAVPEGEELPPGATHEIVEDEHGHKTVRRKRFSAY